MSRQAGEVVKGMPTVLRARDGKQGGVGDAGYRYDAGVVLEPVHGGVAGMRGCHLGGAKEGCHQWRGLLFIHQCGVAVSQLQGLAWLSVSSRPPSVTLASASCSPWLRLVRSGVHRQGGLGPQQWPGSGGVVWVFMHGRVESRCPLCVYE